MNSEEMKKNWYSVKILGKTEDKKKKKCEIIIDGEIGYEDFWDPENSLTSKKFIDDTKEFKDESVDLYINSPGGDVFQGLTIYNWLKTFSDLTVHVMGIAGSIASIIMLASDTRIIHEGSMVVIHNPYMYCAGDAILLRKSADDLDKIAASMRAIYNKTTGQSEDDIKAKMDAETWFTTQEAIDYGFGTEISEEKAAASIDAEARRVYKHIPGNIAGKQQLTIRDAEGALRDAGFSAKRSKEILAAGFTVHRDDEQDFSGALSILSGLHDEIKGVK